LKLFVDTSAFYAALVTSDRDHLRATSVLGASEARPVTSTVVVAELWTLMAIRKGRRAAERGTSAILGSGVVIESVGEGDLRRAFEIGEEFPDQSFSLADRTSFAVMRRLGVHTVATLDDHFAIYRFGPGRRKAFEIAR
jgi:predicted nucleic acid-binding protein